MLCENMLTLEVRGMIAYLFCGQKGKNKHVWELGYAPTYDDMFFMCDYIRCVSCPDLHWGCCIDTVALD